MPEKQHFRDLAENEPLFDILGRVSVELRDVAGLIERLEPILNADGSGSFVQSASQMRLMQGIDLAVQKAMGLAAFLDELGAQLEPDQLVDITCALNLITLEDMKRRLRSAVCELPSTEVYRKASGEPDFF